MSKKITLRHLTVGLAVVWSFFKKYRREVGLLFVVDIFLALGNGFVSYITGKLFDNILAPEQTYTILNVTLSNIIWILVGLLVIQGTIFITEYYNYMRESRVEFFSRFDYVTESYSRLLELPMSFHKTHKIGEVESKIQMAGWGLQSLIGRLITSLGAEFLTVIVAAAVIIWIEPRVALFALTGVIIFILIA